MGVPQAPTHPHLYPQALQLKLYQAFIFSIPILFSIILFLLFYLFYLKRRASNNNFLSPPLPRPRRSQTTTYISSTCQLDLKLEIKEELPIVLFDEELRTRDSQCCVCLGEFVMEEELLQVPSCKHVFHIDCIHLWLHTNTTCPLCRCSVISIPTKLCATDHHQNSPQPPEDEIRRASWRNEQPLSSSFQQQDQASTSSDIVTTTTSSTIEDSIGSVVIHVQTHENISN